MSKSAVIHLRVIPEVKERAKARAKAAGKGKERKVSASLWMGAAIEDAVKNPKDPRKIRERK